MALTKQINLESGIEIPNAYIKIEKVEYCNASNGPNYAEFYVNIYINESMRLTGKPEAVQFLHKCTGIDFDTYFTITVMEANDVNIINQGYVWLKTLSTYSGATDVQDDKE